MTQQRFEAWPPIHLKGGTHGGDLARLLNAGQNGVIRNAVLEVDPHKNRRSATIERVETAEECDGDMYYLLNASGEDVMRRRARGFRHWSWRAMESRHWSLSPPLRPRRWTWRTTQ